MTRRRWVAPGVFLALCILAVLVLITRLHLTNDMSMFLPRTAGETDKLLIDEMRHGRTGRTILVGLTGAAPETLADANKKLAAALRRDERFSFVFNGEPVLGESEKLQLFDARYLLSPINPERFTTAGLRQALEEQLQHLASLHAPLVKEFLPRDPTGEFLRVLQNWAGGQTLRRWHGVAFSQDGERSLMLLTARAGGSDIDGLDLALTTLRQRLTEVAPPCVSLLLAGAPVYATESRAAIARDTALLSTLSVVFAVTVLWAAFRSAAPVLLSVVPLLGGTLFGLVAVALTFGQVHGVTLAFGGTLLGLGIDYPVHYYYHVTRADTDRKSEIEGIWPTIRLGATAAVIGFAALVLSDYEGLAQLGIFSLVGIAVTAAITRFVLPDLTPRSFAIVATRSPLHGLQPLARRARRARALVAVALPAIAVYLVIAGDSVWEKNLAKLSPVPADRIKIDHLLRTDLGAPDVGQLLLVRALNEQAVLEALEALAPALEARIAQGTLGEFQSAARWLPSVATQQKRQSILPPGEVLRARLKQAGTGLPFRANLFEPFIKDIEQARRRAPLTLLSLEGNVLAERVRALLAMTPDGWTAPVLLRGVTDPQPLEALAGDRHGARVVFLDVKKESARVMENYRNRALEVCALGFLAILFVLTIGLRSPIHALRIALTPLAAVLVTVACLTWLGQGLTLFHVIALLLIVGLGIDYSLFFDRLSNDAAEWQTTFPAVVLCWLTTLAVFGSLTLSQAAVLKAIGLTVAIGVTFCLVFAAVWRREGTHDQTN